MKGSTSSRGDPDWQFLGVVAAIIGGLALLYYPFYQPADPLRTYRFGLVESVFYAVYPGIAAILLVWGVNAIQTKHWRSLTGRRIALVLVVVVVEYSLITLSPPEFSTLDVAVHPPRTLIGFVEQYYRHPVSTWKLAVSGALLLAILGVALKREETRVVVLLSTVYVAHLVVGLVVPGSEGFPVSSAWIGVTILLQGSLGAVVYQILSRLSLPHSRENQGTYSQMTDAKG